MIYERKGTTIELNTADSFDIKQTLECGQCFRFTAADKSKYEITAFGKKLSIEQNGEKILFYPTTEDDFENIWKSYFDLNRDYDAVKKQLSGDKTLEKAMDYGSGIRLLNQEPWECLISFIISQNNRIPMIRRTVENISERCGTKINGGFAFPTPEQMKDTDEQTLAELKTGFRSKYIINAVERVLSGKTDLNAIKNMDTKTAKEELLKIKGVGPKIADCVLLFAYGRHEVFPTDVWIKRVIEYYYFNKEAVKLKDIQTFAHEKWGAFAGFAQQYLFYYARSEKIGAK